MKQNTEYRSQEAEFPSTPGQSSTARLCKSLRIVIALAIIAILWTPLVHAQSNTRKMLEQRSIPSSEMWKYLDRAAEFSQAEMRLIDQRSVFNISGEKMMDKRSAFSAAEQRMLTQRSEFSPQMMDLLEKRVEPDAAQVSLLRRQSRADSRWRLRVHAARSPA